MGVWNKIDKVWNRGEKKVKKGIKKMNDCCQEIDDDIDGKPKKPRIVDGVKR